MDWSLRACARKGHLTYRPDEESLRARLLAATPAGPAWRCLRCGAFVLGEPSAAGPADEAPLVLRGRALRDATILRLLAAERAVRGLLLLGLGVGILQLRSAEASLRDTFDRALPAAKPLAAFFHYDLDASPTVDRIRHLLSSRPHTLGLIAVGLFAYAALQLTEAVGLFLMRRWGEYVAAVGTSIFLPLEIYELTHKITVLRLVALLVNLAAVAYLVGTKRLFGVRGGRAAHEEERQSESLLEVEQAAAAQP